jgi:membrane protease YdiL (CAAX protease family)
MDNPKKEIVDFVIVLMILSSASFIVVSLLRIPDVQNSIYFVGFAFSPALAGVVTSLIFNRNLKGFGWKWGKTKYQLLSYFLPVFYGLLVYGFVWVSKIVPINHGYLNQLSSTKGLAIELLTFATVGVFMRGIGAFGEELGWRGFLLPRLMKLTNLTYSSVIIGLIWTLWHIPIILFTSYGSSIGVIGILLSAVISIAASVMVNWIRLRSGSVWTSVMIHASHNNYIQGLYDPLTSNTANSNLIVGEFGIGLAIVSIILGFLFWRARGLVENRDAVLDTV